MGYCLGVKFILWILELLTKDESSFGLSGRELHSINKPISYFSFPSSLFTNSLRLQISLVFTLIEISLVFSLSFMDHWVSVIQSLSPWRHIKETLVSCGGEFSTGDFWFFFQILQGDCIMKSTIKVFLPVRIPTSGFVWGTRFPSFAFFFFLLFHSSDFVSVSFSPAFGFSRLDLSQQKKKRILV